MALFLRAPEPEAGITRGGFEDTEGEERSPCRSHGAGEIKPQGCPENWFVCFHSQGPPQASGAGWDGAGAEHESPGRFCWGRLSGPC